MMNTQCEAFVGGVKPNQVPRRCYNGSCMLVNVYTNYELSSEIKCCKLHLRTTCVKVINENKTIEVYMKTKEGNFEYYEPYGLENIKNLPAGGQYVPYNHPMVANHPPPPPPPVVAQEEPAPLPVVNLPPVLNDGKHPCSICFEDTDDVFCTYHRHVMCQECFENHVLAECEHSEFKGVVKCPLYRMRECDCEGYTVSFIAKHVPEKVFTEYDRKRYEVKEKSLVSKIEDDLKKKLVIEQAMSSNEKDRKFIIDNILTLKCPKCCQAYTEFDGCLSLVCSKCKCFFCAKCHMIRPDSKSSHNHVALCKANGSPTGLFHKEGVVFAIQNNMRKQNLVRFLQGRPNKFELLQVIEKDLRDLKMNPAEFRI